MRASIPVDSSWIRWEAEDIVVAKPVGPFPVGHHQRQWLWAVATEEPRVAATVIRTVAFPDLEPLPVWVSVGRVRKYGAPMRGVVGRVDTVPHGIGREACLSPGKPAVWTEHGAGGLIFAHDVVDSVPHNPPATVALLSVVMIEPKIRKLAVVLSELSHLIVLNLPTLQIVLVVRIRGRKVCASNCKAS